MSLRHRRSLPVLALGLAAATLALVPALATAAPADETREVVAVEPVEGASREAMDEALLSSAGRSLVVAEDGTLRILEDADFTSDASVRRLRDRATALAIRPPAFDLRDATFGGVAGDYVTPVKLQDPFGACWAFAATAAAETSILTETATPVTDPATALDLSDKQLAWFGYQPLPADDPNGQGGEGYRTNFDPATESSAFYNLGLSFIDSTMLYASTTGPIEESADPILGYHNAAGEYEQVYGYDQPVATGDWSLPESLRYRSTHGLEESFSLPSPASWEPVEGSAFERYVPNAQGVEAVKDQLLAGRAVGISFCADVSMPGDPDGHRYLNPETWAQYTYESPREGSEYGNANHAACIVGYDDDYSRENFNADHRPEGDGAFIVKNSWGAVDSTYGNQGDWGIDGSGYFYLSYYDKGILTLEAYDFITPADGDLYRDPDAGAESTLYQYAHLGQTPTSTPVEGVASMANVYEMDGDSVLRYVSLLTYGYGTDVRFDLYRLREGATDPTDGELLCSRDASFAYGGYHRVELDEPVLVEAGDRIGVVATVSLPDGQSELVSNYFSSEAAARALEADPSAQLWAETVLDPGESFYGSPSKRVEYSDGSYVYEGYDWTDYGGQCAADAEVARRIVDDSDFDELLRARDDAFAAWTALPEGDPGEEAARDAYSEAQAELSQLVADLPDETSAAFFAYDNFPLNLGTEAYDPENPPTAETIEMLRLYNPASGEHLFTGDADEALALTTAYGWRDEGSGWTAPAKSNTAVYRLYNPYTGEHLYTTSATERAALVDAGWHDEGVGFHSDGGHATPVYRLNNPYVDGVGAHHFTTDPAERDQCVRNGWRDEGIAWYGL